MQAFDANIAITKMTSEHIAIVSDIESKEVISTLGVKWFLRTAFSQHTNVMS